MITHKNVIKTIECVFHSILLKCVMKYNTPETRRILSERFSDGCQPFVDGGLINEFNVTCNEYNNNTPDIIDNGAVWVDTNIEIDGVIYYIYSYIGLLSGFIDIDSRCKNDEELTNLDRQEKLEYILEEK